ncbi:ABC transporter ATP-binding protein [Heyndrickxia acidicola]|uniref:Energy-coupling factor transporter ATPase n=1 Tax=Heyndrickxia acidicola TaxID=209389 RepID=A0ABU6MJY8_9BACI|nr:energy-coupling factor transporter ATPase [Heyndrickxia acidicola]MED1204321.1 energy-coupling factor transporter ATPase [Heyndrickxia acidicola]
MALLTARNLTFQYPDQEEKALNGLTFNMNKGEFTVLCGPSGSGKSTLLRLLKRGVAPHGIQTGELLFKEQPFSNADDLEMASKIGMVFQDPENQIVMDNVMDELVFGMENVGFETEDMRKRVAEMVHFFGLEDIIDKKTFELSGGQKQLLNLASVLLLEPELLLLDEPTAQLDPIAAKEFIGILHRMNEELGITVIIAEHRLEELFAAADRALYLENGNLVLDGTPREILFEAGKNKQGKMYPYIPGTSILYLEQSPKISQEVMPLTVKEGRQWAETLNVQMSGESYSHRMKSSVKTVLMEGKNVDFQYDKHDKKILDQLSLTVGEGEWLSLVGANGTGKSTLLKIMAGLVKPQRGSIKFNGKKLKGQISDIGYLPQNPKLFFLADTVEQELRQINQLHGSDPAEVEKLLKAFQLEGVKKRHPYDLSGGEIQKAALAGVLLAKPSILLIDEPTKGLDPEAREHFGKLLASLQSNGMTIVMVTHDIEFAAKHSTRCAMMFKGTITVSAPPERFFKGNAFYTTVVNRVTRGLAVPEVITAEEARRLWHVQGFH